MSPTSRSLILALKPEILSLLCAQLFRMQTSGLSKLQIISKLNQSQALMILSSLSL